LKKDVEPVRIHMGGHFHEELLAHLRQNDLEQAAFLFVSRDDGFDVEVRDLELLGADDFLAQRPYYLELTDAARSRALRRAHQLGLALAEAHIHPDQTTACFSPSDLAGLAEFVPHVWWRRRGGPYVAMVLGVTGWDGLAWTDAPDQPRPLGGVVVDGGLLSVTGESWRRLP
jgi:hypothetical protein